MASAEVNVNNAFGQVFNQVGRGAVDPRVGLEVIAALSQLGSELRIWLDTANAFGHHSSTISLLKRMIDNGFAAPIRVFLEEPADAAKLEMLLPGYVVPGQGPPPPTLQYRGVTLNFVYGNKPPPADVAPLLLCGGSDLNPNAAAARRTKANCDFYLQLQPWNWKERDFLVSPDSKVDYIGKQPTLEAPNFSRLAYAQPAVARDDATWTQYAQNPRFAQRVAMAEVLADDIAAATRYYMPIYGLDAGAPKWSALITLILGAVAAQDLMPQRGIPRKPIVLLVFNRTGYWPKLASWFDGTAAVDVPGDDDDYDDEDGEPYTAAFHDYVIQHQIPTRVALNYTDPDNPTPNPQRLRDQLSYTTGNRVLVVAMEGTPQEIFNYFYAQGTLPFVFEGQGTASYAFGLGKPYLSLLDKNYPSATGFTEAVPAASASARAATGWLKKLESVYRKPDPADWPAPHFADALCTLIDDVPAREYFAQVAQRYGDPANDRLLMSLRYLRTPVPGWTW